MSSGAGGTRSPVPRTRWALPIVHAVVVAFLTAAAIVLLVDTPPGWGATDASIVLGLFVLPLLVLGFPWSVAYPVAIFFNRSPSTGDIPTPQLFAVAFAMLAPAVFNVVIHAIRLASARRRHLRSA